MLASPPVTHTPRPSTQQSSEATFWRKRGCHEASNAPKNEREGLEAVLGGGRVQCQSTRERNENGRGTE